MSVHYDPRRRCYMAVIGVLVVYDSSRQVAMQRVLHRFAWYWDEGMNPYYRTGD